MVIAGQQLRPIHRWTARRTRLFRALFGGMFVVSSGIHVYLATIRPEVYGPFADGALFGFVKSAWASVVVPHATQPMLGLATSELAIGLLVLFGERRYAIVGATLMAAFHVALMAFGWGFWFWSVPMLVLLAILLDGLRDEDRAPMS